MRAFSRVNRLEVLSVCLILASYNVTAGPTKFKDTNGQQSTSKRILKPVAKVRPFPSFDTIGGRVAIRRRALLGEQATEVVPVVREEPLFRDGYPLIHLTSGTALPNVKVLVEANNITNSPIPWLSPVTMAFESVSDLSYHRLSLHKALPDVHKIPGYKCIRLVTLSNRDADTITLDIARGIVGVESLTFDNMRLCYRNGWHFAVVDSTKKGFDLLASLVQYDPDNKVMSDLYGVSLI
ncbi:hypothetical protein FOL47_008362 [Perkinsus chesapeaki]|uniref:Uncharacterized protein n=1 Tax=Perkinsus chesapeaki TaxID=330153 RepID=A0A7J6LEJ8_PERCH|nr:hypothetical protein FOL47_008362 [Perkinsus chesapeaki]